MDDGCNNCQRFSKITPKSMESPKTTPSFKKVGVSQPTHCGTQGSFSGVSTDPETNSLETVMQAQGRFYPATVKSVHEAQAACNETEEVETIETCEPEEPTPTCLDGNATGNEEETCFSLPNCWLDQCCSQEGKILGRNGNSLIKFCANEGETAFLQVDEYGNTTLVGAPELCVSNVAQEIQGNTLQDPYDTDYYVTATHPTPEEIADGNYKATTALQTGLVNEPSIRVWNPEVGKLQHQGLSQLPHCVSGQVTDASEIEITGFTPIPVDGSCDTVRCEKKLSGTGLVYLEERQTVTCANPDCEGCGNCEASTTYVATPITLEKFVEMLEPYLTADRFPDLKGEKGDQGDQGIAGVAGEKGDQGESGARGPAGLSNDCCADTTEPDE